MAKISHLIASVREMTADAPISLTQIKSDIFQKILDYCQKNNWAPQVYTSITSNKLEEVVS